MENESGIFHYSNNVDPQPWWKYDCIVIDHFEKQIKNVNK